MAAITINKDHQNWTLLGEVLYKWIVHPTFFAGQSLYQVLLKDIEKKFEEQLRPNDPRHDPVSVIVYNNREDYYPVYRTELSIELMERSNGDVNMTFEYNEDKSEITRVVFNNYRTFKTLTLNADLEDLMIVDHETKQLTFEELYSYVVNSHLSNESGTRCAMLAYDGEDRCNVGKAIGFIVASAAKLGIRIEPKTFQEHLDAKQKVGDKALMLFNNSNIKLPRYSVHGSDNKDFESFVETRLAMTGRLLEQKLKTGDLIEMSVSEQK